MAPNNTGQSESDWSREALSPVLDRTETFDMSRRTMLAATGAGILGGLVSSTGTAGAAEPDTRNAKTRPTIWTERDRENARANVEQYDWAASQRDSAVSNADSRLADWRERFGSDADDPDLESLWRAVTSQEIPRGAGFAPQRDVSENAGNDGRMWKTDTGVENPAGEGTITVPTNDFEAYRQSGLDDRGMFNPDLADDDLLVNEEHPELGEGWGVDDGYGFVDEENVLGVDDENYLRWNFVAHYNHWAVWHHGGGITRVLQELTDAYLLTGEQEYARAGVVMLDRIADVYPELDLTEYPMTPPGVWNDGFWNSHGGMMTGKAVGAYWESNVMRPIIRAYDAFFPAMEGDDELIDFLDAKTEEFPGLDDKDSVEKIRTNIENGILREILPAMKDLNMDSGGNSALAQAARVLDEPDGYTEEAIEWVFQPGDHVFDGDTWDAEPENWYATGGNVLAPMVDVWDRDGYNNRAGPGYNTIQISGTREVADYLQGYDAFDGADLYQHPKMQQALDVNVELLLIDNYTPQIGDQHGPMTSEWISTSIEEGFAVTGESLFAQVWHYDEGYTTDNIRGSIYDEDPEGLSEEIEAVIEAEGPLDLSSRNLPGYGFAALEDGENHDVGTPEWTYDTSELFVDASTEVDDSFPEAIQLQSYQEGEWWTFEFDVPEADEYSLELEALFVGTYGVYEMTVNGELVDTIDFMADGDGEDTLTYTLELPEGTNELRFECVGKNEDSDNYLMALYYLSVREDQDDDVADLGNEKRAFWMYYGRTSPSAGGNGHNHYDALNVGVAAEGLELSPDLGYPEATGSWPKRRNWTENTISHNTVTVDESGQDGQWVGTPRHFEGDDERVNLIDVDAYHSYEQCDTYRRTMATIAVDEEHSYAVDFFRITGGDDHVFSFHGQVGEASATGVGLVAQDGGTYAGEDVPKPGYGEDTEYNQQVGNGFNYLDAVERDDDPETKVTVDWDIEDYWGQVGGAEGVHLRLTSFGDFDEVALADGHPPDRDGNPDSLRYALLSRQGNDLESDFVSAIEHYDGERVVESIDEVDVTGGEGHALKIELTNGRTDYVVCSFDGDSMLTVDDTFQFKGFFGLYSLEDGEPEYAYVHDGTRLRPMNGRPIILENAAEVRGTVEDFTREMRLENELEIKIAGDRRHVDRHAGFVYVDNDNTNPWRGEPDPKEQLADSGNRGRGNGVYQIEALEVGRGNLLTVDVGRQTFIRQFADPTELEDGGYEYIVSEDDDVRIPLSSSWSVE